MYDGHYTKTCYQELMGLGLIVYKNVMKKKPELFCEFISIYLCLRFFPAKLT